MRELILQIVRGATDYSHIDPNMSFEDLPLDSLEFVEMLQQIETQFNIHIEDDMLPRLKTVADLIDLVGDLLPHAV